MRLQAIEPSEELLELQRAAYAVEAELLGDDRIPALHEDLPDLRTAGLTWLGALDGERLVGAVAWQEDEHEVDVHRLVVSPERHRQGVALALVSEVVRRAGARRSRVATGRDNAAARQLYERLGFRRVDEREVLPALWVTRYERAGGHDG